MIDYMSKIKSKCLLHRKKNEEKYSKRKDQQNIQITVPKEKLLDSQLCKEQFEEEEHKQQTVSGGDPEIQKKLTTCEDNLNVYSDQVVKLLGYIEERDDLILEEEQRLIEAERRGRELREQLAQLEGH